MSMLDRLRGGSVDAMTDTVDELSEALRQEQATNELLIESITDLEQDNAGWVRLEQLSGQLAFTRQGLNEIAASARLNWLANPLIRRGVNVRTYYTWGQGVEISARDADVNEVVQAFLDDKLNQQVLFGHDARQDTDRALQLDANLFLSLFTSPLTGRVQVRSLPWTEITRVVSNPQDRADRWFYLREWDATVIDPVNGGMRTDRQRAFYPVLGYRPVTRVKRIGDVEVRWDSPTLHVRVGQLDGMDFGVSEVYSALAWARAYKAFLEDWASLAKALSKFAWKGKAKPGRTSALREVVEGRTTTTTGGARSASGAGQALISSGDVTDLTPISKTGATLDADSGRPLAMMVAAAMDIPYTILMGDPDIGNLATAKTLDRPTELAMQARREMWAGIYRQLIEYVVDQAVKAPRGPLHGTLGRDEYGAEVITLANDAPRDVDIDWPSILEHDIKELVDAIVAADGTERVPPEVIARLLLTALGVENVDEVMTSLVDDDGNFLDPGLKAQITAGTEAIRRFRNGQDDPTSAV